MTLPGFERITMDPTVMGGKPCLRGLRVTVGLVTGLVASGTSFAEILQLYPYLEEADIRAALSYAAWRTEEHDLPPLSGVRILLDMNLTTAMASPFGASGSRGQALVRNRCTQCS